MKKIKIIFSDIDGTINCLNFLKIYKKFIISRKTLNSVKYFLSFDNKLILSTGRTLDNAKTAMNFLMNKCKNKTKFPYLIAMNGAVVYDNIKNRIIANHCFEYEISKKIIKFLIIKKVNFMVLNSNNCIYMPKSFWLKIIKFFWFSKYQQHSLSNIDYQKIQKIILFSFTGKSFKLKKEIESIFSNVYVSCAGKNLCEVVDKNVNKYFAIQKIISIENWEKDSMAAIGNESNDIKMIENIKFGAAVSFKKNSNLKYDEKKIQLHTTNIFGNAFFKMVKYLKEKNLLNNE